MERPISMVEKCILYSTKGLKSFFCYVTSGQYCILFPIQNSPVSQIVVLFLDIHLNATSIELIFESYHFIH